MKPRILLAAAAVAVLGLTACSSDSGGTASPTTTRQIEGVQTYGPFTREHVKGTVDYPQSPPVGGDHNPVWQNCGFYDTPIQNENAVHSLEHGAVWLTYRPDLPADQVDVLRSLVRGHSHVLVSPYPGLTEPVVASAWGLQLRLDSVTDPRLAEFIAVYEQGPQTPELGVTCSGALGDPLD